MNTQEVKEKLIENTIKIIANEGLGKTTTKAITGETGINEAYIYRLFSSKDGLLVKTFDMLDEELVSKVMQYVDVMYKQELEYELRCQVYFEAIWKFLLGNRDKCVAFIRYYYSPYFQKYSIVTHKQRYELFIKKIATAFKEESNVWMILNHVLSTMLDFAIKVYNNELPNNEDTSEHVFRLIYVSIKQYFKD